MKTPRGASLRENLIARVHKKLGKRPNELNDAQNEFIGTQVDSLILSGSATVQDLAHLVHKFLTVFPDVLKPQASMSTRRQAESADPRNHNSSPKIAPAPQRDPRPPSHPTPTQPASHRRSTVERENRLARDADWAKQVDDQAAKFEADRRRERLQDHQKREEQRRVLEAQVEEHRQKKARQIAELREHTKDVIAQTEQELEAERLEREEKKHKMMQDRAAREKMLTDHLEQKRREHARQQDEERRYLQDIQEEEERKRNAELQRRSAARRQFQQYIDENRSFEASKRQRLSDHRETERREMAESRSVLVKRELEAKAELKQQSNARNALRNDKQTEIAKQYEKMLSIREEELRKENERASKAREMHEARAAEEEQRRQERKRKQQQEFTRGLEDQIAAQEVQRQQQRAAAADVKESFGLIAGAAAKSDEFDRRRQTERRAELQRALDAQIRDKEARERIGVQIKI